jgi:hypothetical protein
MRRVMLALSASFLVLAAAAVLADQVVLKDGSSITTAKPYVVKGSQAILTLPDGTLVSLPASQIDGAKTAEANAPKVAKPASSASRLPPQSPGEAAKMKGTRKATIVLTDEDILHPISGGAAAAKEDGEGKIEVTGVTTSRENGVLSVSGSLQNTGGGEVIAVAVTVEAVGDSNKTLSSAFGKIAKDTLGAGEKTTFTAEFADEGVSNFRFLPRWQVRIPVKPADAQPSPTPAAAAQQTPPPAPAADKGKPAEPKFVPRGDVAAPPANAPVGSPTNPNTPYLPQPADVKPADTTPTSPTQPPAGGQ